MFMVINGLFPIRLRDIFQNSSQVHSHKLRGLDINFLIPDCFLRQGNVVFNIQGLHSGTTFPFKLEINLPLLLLEHSC